MDKHDYLRALHDNFGCIAEVAHRGLEPQVPACPAWNVGGLVGHLGTVYTAWNKRLRHQGEGEPAIEPEDFAGLPGFVDWNEANYAAHAAPEGVLEWTEHRFMTLAEALAAASPDQPVKTWFPPDQTAGFAQRRMAQETAMHRWDAQSAYGKADPIEAELAKDGIDEMLDVHLPMRREWETPRASAGERYHLHSTDTPGEWLVFFAPEGVQVTREHAKGDVAIRGTASDLLLWLWGRIPGDTLDVIGDRALLDRWLELVPPD